MLVLTIMGAPSLADARESSAYPDYSYDFMLKIRPWNAEPNEGWIVVDIYPTFQEGEDMAHYYAGTWYWEVDLIPIYNPPQIQYMEAIFQLWYSWGW